jgi:multidrug efflux pump subunit AcrA (membrane-fusion protein)
VGLAVAVAGGGAVAVTKARADEPRGYRTATATTRTVRHELESVAVVEPVSQARVAFPVDGTVATVGVSVGDRVTTGRRLATLDTEELEAALHQEEATLDLARLNLARALDGEDPGALGGSGGSLGGSGAGPVARAVRRAGSAPTEVVAARQAVVDAQAAVDAAGGDAEVSLANAQSLCNDVDADACREALSAALADQQAVTAAQATLVQAIDDLDGLLEAWADDLSTTTTIPSTTPSTTSTPPPSTTSTPPPSTGGGNGPSGGIGATGGSLPSGGSSSTVPGGGQSTTSTGPSAEDLVAYQRAVDAAEDDVAVAAQAIEQAAVVSPIDGTVVSVGIAVGDDVSADDDAAAIVIAGAGGYEVSTTIGVDDLPDVAVGQPATVVPDGSARAIDGEVVRIGVAPTTSGGSTYRVVVGVGGETAGLGNGATAALTITTDADHDQLAVPTSAVSLDGTRASVRVIPDGGGEPVTRSVTIGAVGSTWTAIESGIEPGDRVVLADLDRPLPGSATDSSSGSGSGATLGPGGRGGPPGGFTIQGGRGPGG